MVILGTGCAATKSAPRFSQPSTTAIRSGLTEAKKSVTTAKEKVKAIEKIAEKPEITPDDRAVLKLQIASLGTDLDNALTALDTSEGARQQLDTQLKTETDKANALARDYDQASLTITSLKTSRHRWVKFFIISLTVNIAAIGWIFRKPIMLLLA
jgi:chromosome segregation ATPase